MITGYSEEEDAFREEVEAFMAERLPSSLSEKVRLGHQVTKQETLEWHAVLNSVGWLAGEWPRDHGGSGWTKIQRVIFDIAAACAYAPRILPFGVHMLGPLLIKFGSEEQKAYWLPRILDGSDWWCQGYSEPGAGSDLASLKTEAVRDGDHYVVNGQKTWTTLGQHANMIFTLVRTSKQGRKQEGISFLLIDLASPGIEMRPIELLDGEREVNEVFFTNVRVPVGNLVGGEGEGWTYAKYLLTHERTTICDMGNAIATFRQLTTVAQQERKNDRPLIEDPLFSARLARIEIDIENMKTTQLRVLAAARDGEAPVAESSMLKIRGTEIRQEISSLLRRAVGPYALPFVSQSLDADHEAPAIGPAYASATASAYFNKRKLSIYGGSNEIQRAIIAKSILEL